MDSSWVGVWLMALEPFSCLHSEHTYCGPPAWTSSHPSPKCWLHSSWQAAFLLQNLSLLYLPRNIASASSGAGVSQGGHACSGNCRGRHGVWKKSFTTSSHICCWLKLGNAFLFSNIEYTCWSWCLGLGCLGLFAYIPSTLRESGNYTMGKGCVCWCSYFFSHF